MYMYPIWEAIQHPECAGNLTRVQPSYFDQRLQPRGLTQPPRDFGLPDRFFV